MQASDDTTVRPPVIAIDGPSGSGKGTIARLLAGRLGWNLLDSGALYRLVAYSALHAAVRLDDVQALAWVASGLEAEFVLDPNHPDGVRVMLDDEDVTEDIRSEAVGEAASNVAAYPRVREALVDLQRRFLKLPGLVADGRDMGTVVFPFAALKIFLTATVEERAQRRHKQLKDKGMSVSLARLLKGMEARDQRDETRAASPLRPAEDAVVIDSTALTIEQVLERVLDEAKARRLA
jgi:cytidylate kinase